jgi:transcription initiation factor TFIID subunit 15
MGDIPASNKMISAVFQSPTNDQDFTPNSAITFSVKIANLQAGSFTNPDNTYYAAPQALQGGVVVGHTHISVQDLGGSANPANAPDAETFAFFKGVNDAGDGNGLLSADLAAGLPAGTYRVCSMTSASNHQPVVMPVAQRGPQDDCVRFTVGANNNGGQNNNGQNGQQNGQQGQGQQGQAQQAQGQQGQAQQGQAQQGQQQQGQQAQGQQGQAQQGQGGAAGRGRGRGRGRLNRPRFAARDFIA